MDELHRKQPRVRLLLRHPQPRPWLVCVHGTEMGRAALDLALFRAWRLHEDLGLNVVMPILPMHDPRARGLPKGAVFPGEDILDDVHATGQAVWDIRRLLSWIRSQEPESQIGLNGLSLGGYIAALVASLETGLTCAILGVPVADLVGLLGRHSGLAPDDPRRQTMELAEPIGLRRAQCHATRSALECGVVIRLQPHWEDRVGLLTRVRVALRYPGEVFVLELVRPLIALGTRGLLLSVKHRVERSSMTTPTQPAVELG